MKRIIALVLTLALLMSLLPVHAVASEVEVHIEDTYVYDCMRGDDGKFHNVTSNVVETHDGIVYGRGQFDFELNSTTGGVYGDFTLSDTQDTTPWEVGEKYPVTYNDNKTFYVEVLETPVSGVVFSDCKAFYDEEQNKYFYNPYTEISYKDGSGSASADGIDSEWLYPGNFDYNSPYDFGYTFYMQYVDTQGFEEWIEGNTYEVTGSICGFSDTFTVTAVKPKKIKSITIDPIEHIKGTGDWYDVDDINGVVRYMEYSVYPDKITVTFEDDTFITGTSSEIWEEIGASLICESDQSYENQWGVGKHTATAFLGSASAEYTVEIVETPIKSIAFRPIQCVVNVDGWTENEYNVATDEYDLEWFHYSVDPQYTVTLKDNTVLESDDDGCIQYQGEWYYLDFDTEQNYENQWSEGTYTIDASILGFETEFTVEVIPSPIQSVTFEPIEIIEKTGGENYGDWYEYNLSPDFTVTMKDGTVLESDYGTIEYQGSYYHLEYNSHQTPDNPWVAGNEYTVDASVFGYDTSFTVKILESPVQSVTVQPIELIEKMGGSFVHDYNPETDEYDLEWYRYSPDLIFTVTLKDGTVLESNEWGEIKYEDYWYYCSYDSDQSYENQWVAANQYEMTGSILGYDFSVSVKILETPIESVVVDPIKAIEKTNGSFDTAYNPITGNYDATWYRYWFTPEYTVTFKDGTVASSENGMIEYQGKEYWFDSRDDQSYENQWMAGNEYTYHLTILGFDTTAAVEIVESPVKSVTVQPVELYEEVDGYIFGEDLVNWFYYGFYHTLPEYTVTLKDNTVLESKGGEVVYNGETYCVYVSSDQRSVGGWKKGNTYQAMAHILGAQAPFDVTIVENTLAENHKNVTYTVNMPTSIKMGDRMPETDITFHGLTPYKRYDCFFDDCADFVAGEQTLDLRQVFCAPEAGYGAGSGILVDSDGNLICNKPENDSYYCLNGAYACHPGKIRVLPTLYCGEDIPVGDPFYITVEAPVIENNAPSTANVGSTLNLTTALGNVTATNQKVTGKLSGLAFAPKLEVLEGASLIQRSNADYTNTLSTAETIRFAGAGTVKLKVVYEQIETFNSYGDKQLYDPELIITIEVTENNCSHQYDNACDTTCNVCKATRTITHKFGEYVYNKDATYDKDGTKTRTCSVCKHKETITAAGTKLEKPLIDSSKTFTDIPKEAWHKQFVDYAVTHGIFKGTSTTEFSPDTDMTRAQFVQVFANLAGIDTSNQNVVSGFSDVPKGKWYTGAVTWAAKNSIVAGVGNGKFDPEAKVTREQMCVMLVNFIEKYMKKTMSVNTNASAFVDDASISSWAKTAVYKCAKAGLVNGVGNNKFAPKDFATRAQGATLFTNFHKSYIK